MRAFALAVLVACGRAAAPAPGTPDDLAAYLHRVAGADEATRRHEIAGWILDEASWRRTVVDPYRDLWPGYARGFDAATAALLVQLASPGDITARRHYAGDPRLTRSQGRLRWTLPVQYPSAVADLAGAPIDTVFVFDGARWRVLAGLDELVLARVRAQDPVCADMLARAGGTGRCSEVGWLVADAGMRGPPARFVHACRLAATLCGNASP
jgi:hypothetical protein